MPVAREAVSLAESRMVAQNAAVSVVTELPVWMKGKRRCRLLNARVLLVQTHGAVYRRMLASRIELQRCNRYTHTSYLALGPRAGLSLNEQQQDDVSDV